MGGPASRPVRPWPLHMTGERGNNIDQSVGNLTETTAAIETMST